MSTSTTGATTGAETLTTPALDPSQARVARAVAEDGGAHVVHGAPGSGKTHLALALTVDEAERGGQPMLLVPTRLAAATLRHAVTRRIGRTLDTTVVRTPASLAFAILRLRAGHLGEVAPTLISGPEQDQVLAELLAGHVDGEGAPIVWPEGVGPQTWQVRAFRNELRDVMMRAAEAGLGGEELSRWGRRYGRPEWVGAGQILTEYTQVMALGQVTPDRGARYDAAGIVDEAVAALTTWEEELPGVPRPRWSLVVHDDYQDATLATARLLAALAEDGAARVVLGEADAAVQSFRGGVPELLATAAAPVASRRGSEGTSEGRRIVEGAWGAREHVLTRAWRHGPALREGLGRLTTALPVLAAGARREAAPGPGPEAGASRDAVPGAGSPEDAGHHTTLPGGVRTAVLGSPAQEVAYVARRLRVARLHHQVPWSRMAVVARSSAGLAAVRRGLLAAGVPLALTTPDRPLREEPAVRPLLGVLRAVLSHRMEVSEAVELLTSPIAGLDAVGLRALRRHLRATERLAGGSRHSGELLVDLLADPEAAEQLPPRHRRAPATLARVLAATRRAAETGDATAETVLWAAWEAAALATTWQQQALRGGSEAHRADADLDAVMALFRAAEQFVDRTAHSSPAAFVEYLSAQDFPADSLAERGQGTDAVAVHTAAGAAGGQWDVVAVVGVQEDVWPDLRIRDTLLGAAELADLATGRHVPGEDEAARMARARKDVADGELRAFVSACARARQQLYVTAVLDEDERPSVFLDLLNPDGGHETEVVSPPLNLRGLVGQLRSAVRPVLVTDSPEPTEVAEASEAAAVLSYLARNGVSEADPASWGVRTGPTSSGPLLADRLKPTLSPSAVEQIITCPLRWVLTRHGGQPPLSDAQQFGILIHEIAAAHPHGDAAAMVTMLDERWAELDPGPGWTGQAQYERARSMLTRFAEYAATRPGRVETEVGFEVELDEVILRGRVDRVEHLEAGQVRIVDLKTSTTAETKAKAGGNPQLGAYQVAIEAGAFGAVRSAGAALIYPGTKAKSTVIRQQEPLEHADDPTWAHQMLTEAGRILVSDTFEARPNDQCPRCPVRMSCPAFPAGAGVEATR